MKLIYTNENRFLVSNVKNILQNANIEVALKNEFIGGGAGDLSPFDTWLELWVSNDSDYNKAMDLVNALDNPSSFDWVCNQCNEPNNAAFEICWQCQSERPDLKTNHYNFRAGLLLRKNKRLKFYF